MFGLHSEQNLISKVLFSFLKCIQLITIQHQRRDRAEQRKMSEKEHLRVQERLIKQREKCLASLLSVASRQLGETERF